MDEGTHKVGLGEVVAGENGDELFRSFVCTSTGPTFGRCRAQSGQETSAKEEGKASMPCKGNKSSDLSSFRADFWVSVQRTFASPAFPLPNEIGDTKLRLKHKAKENPHSLQERKLLGNQRPTRPALSPTTDSNSPSNPTVVHHITILIAPHCQYCSTSMFTTGAAQAVRENGPGRAAQPAVYVRFSTVVAAFE